MRRFDVLNATGGLVLPVTDGATFYTGSMTTEDGQNAIAYIEFFSDAAGTLPVTGTAGTVDIRATPTEGAYDADGYPKGGIWLRPAGDAVTNIADVSYPDGKYTPVSFFGRMIRGKVTFSAPAGAAYARVFFWKFSL